MNKSSFFFMLLLAAGLCACGPKQEPAAEAHHEEAAETDQVTLTGEQVRLAGIGTGPVESRNLAGTMKISGVLRVPSEHRAVATSLFSGTIRSISIQPGSYVRKGQVIATLANAELATIQQQYIEQNARLRLAGLEYERQQQLVQGNAAPMKNLQKAAAERTALQASVRSLREQLVLMGVTPGKITTTISVKSPISGSVSHIPARIGSPADPSTPIAEIVDNAGLHLDAFVYEQDLDKIREGQEIDFALTNSPDGKTYKAKIYSIGTAFEQETKAIPVHARVLGSSPQLIDGMSVTGLLNITDETVPAVPSGAVVRSKGQDYIFIQGGRTQEGTVFRRIPVARGVTDLGYTGITPAVTLPASAQIVTKGAYFILAAMTNTGEHED